MKSALLLVFACMSTASLTAATGPAFEPTGAALAFTSTDPIVLQARELIQAGRFEKAEALLGRNASEGGSESVRARSETAEILRRIRFEYSLDADALLAAVRTSIPNATAKEVERWADQSHARYRMIDGKKFFFRREPRNIFLFSAEARKRRAKAGNAPAEATWKLTDHLQAIVDEAERTGSVEVQPVRHTITHTLTIRGDTPGIKAGSVVRVWLPFPQEYRQQRSVKLLNASPEPRLTAPNGIDGQPVGGAPQRTLYFEEKVEDPSKPLKFQEVFEYTCFAYYPKLDEAGVQPLPADWNGTCLGERPPHIVFTPEMKREVSRIIGRETNALAKARKLFRWVSANVPWNAEDEYCTIPSFALKGFTARRGDCGIQNTVFITLCRIAGVPARWQSGFETKPLSGWGMHDWAEIYIPPWGWVPADASYGVKPSKDPRIADFYCGHQDSYRLIVSLDWGRDLVPPKTSLRSEPADFQRGEVEVDGRSLYYDQWDYTMQLEREPGPNPD